VPFKSLGAVFYSPSIVTMEIYCIVGKIWRLICRKSRIFYTRPVFSAPAGGDPVWISWMCLMLIKLEWLGYRMVKKKLWLYVKRFSSDTGTLLTDGQTDRFAISISRARVSMLTRDKNGSRKELVVMEFTPLTPLFPLKIQTVDLLSSKGCRLETHRAPFNCFFPRHFRSKLFYDIRSLSYAG